MTKNKDEITPINGTTIITHKFYPKKPKEKKSKRLTAKERAIRAFNRGRYHGTRRKKATDTQVLFAKLHELWGQYGATLIWVGKELFPSKKGLKLLIEIKKLEKSLKNKKTYKIYTLDKPTIDTSEKALERFRCNLNEGLPRK